MRPLHRARAAAGPVLPSAAALALILSCSNSGADLAFAPLGERVVGVAVYLDRDGSGIFQNVIDTLFRNARVVLHLAQGSDSFRIATTDQAGEAYFTGVPLGRYRVGVVPGSIGDSIEVKEILNEEMRVEAGSDTTVAVARLGYPEVSIREARQLPPGRRVFLRGLVLAGVQSFRDTTSHVADTSGFIRLTRVSLRGGLTGNAPGDSVSVLGVSSSREGQPTLDLALLSRLATRPAPIAFAVSTGVAAAAQDGALDAALVLITGAIIEDTATVAPDFRVTVGDGTGSLDMMLDGNINFPRAAFAPGRSLNARGVLVPNGVGGWSLKPRSLSDVVLN